MPRSPSFAVPVAILAAVALSSCGTGQPVASSGSGADAGSCVLCHGDAARSPAAIAPAPPKDTKGNTATTAAGVGAHQRHLAGGAVRSGVACTECHTLPRDASHATQPLQLTWGPIARADGAAPAFDAASLTCANYCHGATMRGGADTAPVWTRVDGSQSACGSCHAMPPPSPHPAVGSAADGCARCHAGTVRSDGTIDLAGRLHVNGAVDVSGGSCTGCHGDPDRLPAAIAAAPPVDVAGNASSSAPGVGAHERHLRGGSLRSGVACTECHVVPTDSAHASQPLQLAWGPLARAGGATPTFDAGSLTCTNYCHGASATAGAVFAPVWNRVDGTQAACGTCHGVPPPAPHPAAGTSLANCAACHPGTVRPDGTIDVAGGLHVNGAVDVLAGTDTCTGCHGDASRSPAAIAPAPPRDTRGNVATSAPGVGAHQRHLLGGSVRGALACSDCHTVPADAAHATQPLDLTWGALARADGVTPTWNPSSLTCANYCHGTSMRGGTVPAPTWNRVDGTQAACGACHGLPPPAPHPPVGTLLACVGCHPGTMNADGTVKVAGGLHVNGTVEFSSRSNCTSCHGEPGRTTFPSPAPPMDTHGNTATTAPGVGAHARHLVAGTVHGPIACTECHAIPVDARHASEPLQLTWGPLARAGGVTPTYDAASRTCTNYCHGATSSGGSAQQPVWNRVDGTQGACGSCHGLPPTAHPPVPTGVRGCNGCHAGTVRPDGTVDLAAGLHLNGTVDFSGTGGDCTGCHGDPTRSPAAIAPAPPRDSRGNTGTTAPGVGAHQAHLAGGAVRGALACTECHAVPADIAHAAQPLQLTWGPLARANGATPTFDAATLTCANYCHGTAGTVPAPAWNRVDGTQAACGACHGLPPANHPAVAGGAPACNGCHAGTVRPDGSIDLAGGLHVNGLVELSGTGGSCTGCHGDPARTPVAIAPAPPLDARGNTATTAPGVGAHQAHLAGGTLSGGVACTECHATPADIAHATEPLQLTWGPLARASGATPAWNGTSLTCSNYCHGSTVGGGLLSAPVWNRVDGTQDACGTCHGVPPAAPHPRVSSSIAGCSGCHSGTVDAGGAILVAGGLHVNGNVDIAGSGNCTGCHGDAARTPPSIAAAPPLDTTGNSAASAPGVGAHQRHLQGGAVRSAIGCSECHVVPADLAHASQPLQLTWGPLARAAGTTPTWDGTALTCTNYCHGTSGAVPAPRWTTADGTQGACGACHGLPPAAHPLVTGGLPACNGCHAGTVRPAGSIDLAGGLHVNGAVEISGTGGSCTGCHGDPARTPVAIAPAPPLDTRGQSLPTAPGVGAHQRHLGGGVIRSAMSCTDCHPIPADIAHASRPTAFAWSALARADGVTPAFDATALTCSNYCHGASLSLGSVTRPVWNRVDGTQAACGTCHGLPPASPHPAVSASLAGCAACHPGTVRADGSIDLAGGLHVDGLVQASGHGDYTSPAVHGPAFLDAQAASPASPSCTGCHGSSYDGVGSIPSCNACHLASGWTASWQTNCSFCHGSRSAEAKAGYVLALRPTLSAPPDDVAGRLGGTSSPARTGAHQAHLAGTIAGGPGLARPFSCDTCHAVPTDLGHVEGSAARAVVTLSAAGQASLPASLGSYDPASGTCATYCHGATLGGAAVAAPRWSVTDGSQAACGACHGLPPPLPHPAVAGGAPACNGCHAGTVRPDGTVDVAGGLHVNGLVELAGTGGCTGCHGDPARTPVEIAAAPPLDTRGRTETTAAGVGAHQRHLRGGTVRGPFACTECHAVPGDLVHASQPLQLTWGPIARAQGASPSFDANALTCANYCHGATMASGALKSPVWNRVDGTQAACGACHGVPPPSPHPTVTGGVAGCNGCHAGTVRPDGSVDLAGNRHVNGAVELAGTGGCTGCHGDPARTPVGIAAAPPRDTKGNVVTTAAGVGAHQAHLVAGTVRGPVPCTECHVVPGDVSHASQTLQLTWGPIARSGGVTPTFNPASLGCTNHCHGSAAWGASVPQPLWNKVDGTQAACGACHGLPPPSPHPTVTGGLTACVTCHAATLNPDGSLDVAGGAHVDGTIQASGHGDYSSPAVHGPQFFAYLRGTGIDCASCHGATFDGGMAPSCNACHLSNGWTASWKTNCSFCHGTRSAFTRTTPYTVTAQPTLSAPPDDIQGRLTGSSVPSRTGAHRAHLTGTTASGASYSAPFPCATCHVVPSDLSHIGGPASRATVTVTGGSYSPATGTCTTACHGAAPSPAWASFITRCDACHGLPPDTGFVVYGSSLHAYHWGELGYACKDCHADTAILAVQGGVLVDALKPDKSFHVNGSSEVRFQDGGSWNVTTGSCATSCHGGAAMSWR